MNATYLKLAGRLHGEAGLADHRAEGGLDDRQVGAAHLAVTVQVGDGSTTSTQVFDLDVSADDWQQWAVTANVAAEVRALAQRSAAAAHDIKALLDNSVHSVDEGTARVDEATRQIGRIVQQVRGVSDTVAHISHAADEQARGIEQVNQAVAQLDEVTQQNAALVEQSAAAAGSLHEQAGRLNAAVERFRVAG